MRLAPLAASALLTASALASCSAPAPPAAGHVVTTPTAEWLALLPDSWPCGDHTCLDKGTWGPIDSGWADALAEGDTTSAPARDWTSCYLSVGDTSYVVCPDGTVETS